MDETLIEKINIIESSFERQQDYFVSILFEVSNGEKEYYVFLNNKNFRKEENFLWTSSDFIIPFKSKDLDACKAEASVWARFFNIDVDISCIN